MGAESAQRSPVGGAPQDAACGTWKSSGEPANHQAFRAILQLTAQHKAQ